MISQACIDLSAGHGHKLVHWVWHTHVFHFSHSIWFDFDHFRRLLLASLTQCPWMSHGPQGYLGWLFQESWLASLALPLLPGIIPFSVSPRNLSFLHSTASNIPLPPSAKQGHCGYECTWNLNEIQDIHSHFAFLPTISITVFPVFSSTRGREAARQHAIFHRNTNTHSSRLVKWWALQSDEFASRKCS